MTMIKTTPRLTTGASASKAMSIRFARGALAIAVAATLAACASAPPSNPALEDAHAAYNLAAGDPNVARSAPVELGKAQQALQRADMALKDGKDVGTVDYYAGIASKRTSVAMQAGKVATAEQAVAEATTRRDRIVIDARTQEAERAQRLAEQRLVTSQNAQSQAEQARARAQTLEDELTAMKAKKTDRGMVLTLGDVLFDTGRAELKPGAYRTLDQLAGFLTQNTERTVEIDGYTDSAGSDQTNQVLSERRAEAVRGALISRSVAPSRVVARGFGESSPIANNDTAAGRQQNRRVEIVINKSA